MARLLLLVEGQTEERFVLDVLTDHLAAHGVFPRSTLVFTKKAASGKRWKGGVTSWNQTERDLRRLLGDSNAAGVTTILDYYALPTDFPGMRDRPDAAPRARVEHVEEAIAARIADRRFRPYLMLHEFEAMLFTDIGKWQHRFDDPRRVTALKANVAGLAPEAINETPQGAPSKRIERHLPEYSKVVHGTLAIRDIGLDAIRSSCTHFADWLTWAEGLAGGDDAAPDIGDDRSPPG